ncbi:hypothetical protein Vadar_007814 [Vaccinium darrowii]|uniref:Uncharacterized protein n=1 Tax=Vaccinium darrowii TaxID=229202 RepID=A0ACB7X8W1_9ERIC|nr:hypothetical protein Vadar_007814 [Vaccinium darrowii]
MHRFVRNCISLTHTKRAAYSPTQICSPSCLQSFESLCTDVSSTTSSTNQNSSFTVRTLINSCGFRHQFVLRLESSKRPASVLKFLEDEGVSRSQIEIIVSKYPQILFTCVQKILKPKFEFFRSVGFSEADTGRLITICPFILVRSVENYLIPSFESLRAMLGGQQNAVDAINLNPTVLRRQVTKNLAPNVEFLRNIGTPNWRVTKMIARRSDCAVASNAPHRFRKDVKFLTEMGFDPSLSSFIQAIIAKGHLTELNWEDRLEFFRSLGFSNEEIISMFKKQPITLSLSKEKIRAAVEFFINTFHWSPTQLSKKPNILLYSLGKRIIPRCSVLQILVSRSMIDKSVMVSSLLVMTEGDFLEKFMTNYKDEVPELLDAYQGKLKFDEYNFDPCKI